jgi:hypothetical protein
MPRLMGSENDTIAHDCDGRCGGQMRGLGNRLSQLEPPAHIRNTSKTRDAIAGLFAAILIGTACAQTRRVAGLIADFSGDRTALGACSRVS